MDPMVPVAKTPSREELTSWAATEPMAAKARSADAVKERIGVG